MTASRQNNSSNPRRATLWKQSICLTCGTTAAVAAFLFLTPSLEAANDAWSTTPATANFSGQNWTLNATAPGSPTGTAATGDALYFGTSSITTLNNDDVGFSFTGFTFNSGASAFVIGDGTANANAGSAFTLTGNITNSSTALQTINNPFATTAVRTVTMTTGGGNVVLGGNISGAGGGLSTGGVGTLTLSGNNSYTGGTSLGNGTTLNLNSATAIGTGALNVAAAATIDNTSGAALALTNNNAVTLGSNLTFTGTNSLSFGTGVFTLSAGNRTITATANTLTVGSIDADTTGRTLSKAGAGTLAITGAAGTNFQGGYAAAAGTTLIGNKSSLGTGTITLSGGALSASADLSGTNAVANTVVQTGNATVGGTNNLTLSGGFTLSGGSKTLTVSNTGATVLSGPIYLSESTTTGRTLTIAGTGATSISGAVSNANGGGTTGSLVYSGTGSLTLFSGGSTFSGVSSSTASNTAMVSTTLSSGTLIIGADSTTNGSGVVINSPVGTGALLIGSAALQGTGGPHTLANPLRTTGSTVINGANDLTFTGGISNFTTGTASIMVNNTGLTTFSTGAIVGRADATAPGGRTLTFSGTGRINVDAAVTSGTNDVSGTTASTSFVYSGTSTLRSTGANTYNGTTMVGSATVTTGTLLVNGTHTGGTNSNTLSQAYTVYGTLGGTGTINLNTASTTAANRTITIMNGTTAGGTLAPGDSTLPTASQTGVLNLNSPVVFANTATVATTLAVQLGGNTAGNGAGHYDQVNTGSLTLGTNTVLSLSIVNGYAPTGGDILYLATQSGTTPISGTFLGIMEGSVVMLPDGSTATATYAANWNGSEATSTFTGGNDFALMVSVPEPATWLAGGLLVGLTGLRFRRRLLAAKA